MIPGECLFFVHLCFTCKSYFIYIYIYKKNDHELVKVFNEHYINIIEKSGGEKLTNITKEHSFDNDKLAVDIICNSHKNQSSISKMRSTITAKENTNDDIIFSPEIVTELTL